MNRAKNKDIIDDKLATEFGTDYIKILISQLKKDKKSSSGSLIKSLDTKVKNTARDIEIFILSNDYLTNVDEGRKAGSYPPIQAISKWARIKNIPQSAVFPIAKSIFKFGIKPTNVIQATTRMYENNKTLTNKYEDKIVDNIENNIFEEYIKETKKFN